MARSLVLPACLAIIFMYVYETSEYNFTASPEDRKELFKRYQLKMKELKTPKGKLSKHRNIELCGETHCKFTDIRILSVYCSIIRLLCHANGICYAAEQNPQEPS